jgi:hypothetical protein
MAIQRQKSIVPTTLISSRIFLIRNTRVMLDADLATLYRVSTTHTSTEQSLAISSDSPPISCFD